MIENIKVKNFASVITGGTPSTREKGYWDKGNIAWLNSGELNQEIVKTTRNYITELGLNKSSARLMPEHTVLIALTGTTTGVVGYLTFEASANQSVTGILPSDRHIPKYLFYYLKSIRPKVLHDAYGGAQPHISQGYVKELEIPLPPLDQQKKIAAILDAADAYRQKTKTLITKYEELTQSLFLEMFGDDTGTLTELGKVIKTVGGGTPSKDNEQYWNGNIPWASVKDLKSDRLTKTQDFITQSGVDNSATRVVPNGSLIVATRMAVGRAVICEMDVAINQDLKAIQTTGKINITYLLYLFKSKKNYFDSVSSGATVKGIKIEHITKLKVNLPNYSKQNQFADSVKAIEAQKAQAQASLAKAEDLFNSLLQRAFKGELS